MPRYIPYDYNQQILMPVSLKDQILPGTMEYVIHHLVEEELDLSSLEDDIKNDNTGRPAIDPKIIFKIVLLAYSKGIIYSRRIEKACRENAGFVFNLIKQFFIRNNVFHFLYLGDLNHKSIENIMISEEN